MRHNPARFEIPDGFWDRDEVRQSLGEQDMGMLFRLLRKRLGATQDAIGVRVGMSQPDISKIANGRRRVEEHHVFAGIAEGLGMPPDARRLLGVAHPGDAEEGFPERVGVAALPAVHVEPPRRVGPEAADALRGALAQYAKLDNLIGPRHVMAAVAVHLDFVGRILDVAAGPTRTRVLRVGASFAEFAGWIHQDAGDAATALRWSDRALEWAAEAGDQTIVSYVLTRKSHQAAALRDRAGTLGLAEAALRDADRVSPRTRALALRQLARGHALARDADACARALDAARGQAARGDDHGEAERTLTGYCTPAYIELEAADCWLTLGRAGDAIQVYETCLADWPAAFERDRGVHLARLATAHAAARDPERACAAALDAVPIAADTGSARAADELRRLPGWLGRWKDTEGVRVLAEALRTLPDPAGRQRRRP
jgi:transcriptional regulator with XRE-family HTH domain